MSGDLLVFTFDAPAGVPSYLHSYATGIYRLSKNRIRVSFTPSNFIRCVFMERQFAAIICDDFSMDDNTFCDMIEAMKCSAEIPLIININFVE